MTLGPSGPRVEAILGSREFGALSEHFKPFVHDGSQQEEMRLAAAPLGALARRSGWTPADLVKALRADGCSPGSAFEQAGAERSLRYARALDMLLSEYFKGETSG
jgi:hypothetical protein